MCNNIYDDMMKLFQLTFHKIHESLMKKNVSNIKIYKEPIKSENLP